MLTLNETIVLIWLIPVLLHILLPLAVLAVWLVLRPFGLFKTEPESYPQRMLNSLPG